MSWNQSGTELKLVAFLIATNFGYFLHFLPPKFVLHCTKVFFLTPVQPWFSFVTFALFLFPPHNEVVEGYIGFTPSVRLSVRPAFRVHSVVPTVLVWSISYLYILSSNFRRCVVCNVIAKFQNLNFWQIFQIYNFDFVLFWLWIWCESLVWIIMGRQRVSQNAGVLVVLVTGSMYNI